MGDALLRRIAEVFGFDRTGNLEAVRVLLGQDDIGSTARFLGDSEPQDALAISRAHEM